MRFTRIVCIPFALAADVVTLGNMGGRSFTQQLFDAERREQEWQNAIELARNADRRNRVALCDVCDKRLGDRKTIVCGIETWVCPHCAGDDDE